MLLSSRGGVSRAVTSLGAATSPSVFSGELIPAKHIKTMKNNVNPKCIHNDLKSVVKIQMDDQGVVYVFMIH